MGRSAALTGALALLGAVGIAAPAAAVAPRNPHPKRISLETSACAEQHDEVVRPTAFGLGCSSAGGNLPWANDLHYRDYGRPVAYATAVFHQCLLTAPGAPLGSYTTWRACPEADLTPQEESEYAYHAFAGRMRFSHVILCSTQVSAHRLVHQLFYTEMSFVFADKPWRAVNYVSASGRQCPGAPVPSEPRHDATLAE